MLGYLLSSIAAIAISSIVMLAAMILSKRSPFSREKMSPFECGFDPMTSARLPFSLRFFLLAVIFLIFDIEIVLLFPPVTKMYEGINLHMLISLFAFLFILLLGLFHEWNEGSLNWIL